MSNISLNNAIRNKEDEFYTTYESIEKEVSLYKDQFKGKKVLCNCDNPDISNFWKFFVDHFVDYELSELVSVYYDPKGTKITKCVKKDNDLVIYKENIDDTGDFRDNSIHDLLKSSDICVTNPPFSLFKEFLSFLVASGKNYLIIGPMNALKYKTIFPLIKEGKVWVGNHCGDMAFRVPDYYEPRETRFWVDETGQKWRSLGNICWFTNMKVAKKANMIKLTETYNQTSFPTYETIDAIEVSKVEKIPHDYKGLMGVPITFLTKHNPNQFEIVGELNHGCDNKYDLAKPVINGKELYTRILIRAI